MAERDKPPELARRHGQSSFDAWFWLLIDYTAKVGGILAASLTPYLRLSHPHGADICAMVAAFCAATLTVLRPERTSALFWTAMRVVDVARRKYKYEDGTIVEVNRAFTTGERILQGWIGTKMNGRGRGSVTSTGDE
jgi:hypothetical protein